MNKNYRDYTVGELLDKGFDVQVSLHNIDNKEEAEKCRNIFQGCKQSSHYLRNANSIVYNVWKGNFKGSFYMRGESE